MKGVGDSLPRPGGIPTSGNPLTGFPGQSAPFGMRNVNSTDGAAAEDVQRAASQAENPVADEAFQATVPMDEDQMLRLKDMHLAPYIQLATRLIGKRRRSGGNMFRHQIDTMAILMDYGYIDSILLKASVIHDLLEDIPDFDRDILLTLDRESTDVFKLVLEVTRRPIENKVDFLARIRDFGSPNARILKSADRISNMISLGYVTDIQFIRRYTDETEAHVYPIAGLADPRMVAELEELVATRREYLARRFEI